MNNSDYILYSYTDFITERNKFRMVDSTGVNRYDSPAALYYKLIFYFPKYTGGLLGIDSILNESQADFLKGIKASFKNKNESSSENTSKNIDSDEISNSAYNFLLLNDELERAEYLKQFIKLLSNISSESPWYFQEIGGLDTALERKVFSDGEMKLEDTKKQITIKCLQDSYDNRIGTLLDLYRAACFSYQNKKEIVPANLRKFNMGILLFNAPIRCKTGKSSEVPKIQIPEGNSTMSAYIPSAKLIELKNCEFDYNSAKSAFSTLNTSEDPFDPEYTITIYFDECYESRYNEIMNYIVTDFINIDINNERNNIIYNGKNIKTEDKVIFGGSKTYWTNTDIETLKDRLHKGILYDRMGGNSRNIQETIGNSLFPNVLTSQVNNLLDKTKEAISVPSIKSSENIHNNGTINQIGEFEYLNHISGNNSIIGSLGTQASGAATNELIDKAKSIYLGNIRGKSVSNMINMTEKALAGDVFGIVNSQKIVEQPKEKENISGNLFYSTLSYEYNINTAKGKINKAKSARNNI